MLPYYRICSKTNIDSIAPSPHKHHSIQFCLRSTVHHALHLLVNKEREQKKERRKKHDMILVNNILSSISSTTNTGDSSDSSSSNSNSNSSTNNSLCSTPWKGQSYFSFTGKWQGQTCLSNSPIYSPHSPLFFSFIYIHPDTQLLLAH